MTEFSQKYWNELLEKYQSGTISEKDRFQLEKQALDDPFLFDALEGFSLYQDERKEEKKRTNFFTLPRLAMAASLVLLVVVIINLKTNLNTSLEEDQSIAMVLDKDDGVASEAEENAIFDDSNQNQNEATSAVAEAVQNVSNKPSKPQKAAEDDGISEIVTNNRTEVDEITPPVPSKDTRAKSNELVNAELEEEIGAAKEKKELVVADIKETVLEEVVAVDNEGKSIDIANATNFEKFEQDPKTDIVSLDSQTNKRNGALDDLKAKAKSLTYFEAVPVIGKEIFDDYAKQRIDERGLRKEKPQEVTIEFKIDRNGNLSDFHHIFSGCSECGPFAITILQNSGEWKTIPPGFSGKARYTFIF